MTMTVVITPMRKAVFHVTVQNLSSAAVMVDVYVECIIVMENIIVMITVMKVTATQPATIMNFSAKTHITAYSCKLFSSIHIDLLRPILYFKVL
jgi:hypothetical protein